MMRSLHSLRRRASQGLRRRPAKPIGHQGRGRPNSRKKRRERWREVQRGFAPYLRDGHLHPWPAAPTFRGVYLWLYNTLMDEESWHFGRTPNYLARRRR